jgi:hypothetical protein
MRVHRFLVLTALLAVPAAASAETPTSDPQAVAIADRVMEALGGKQRWAELRGIRWSFGFEQNDTVRSLRRHSWDKHTGWHRVEGKTRSGQPFCYVENIHDGTGKAWVDGQAIEPDSAKKLMQTAKRMWTNDTYWMLMPYKLRDPGVILGYDGEVKDSTGTYDRITLAFDNVGQTPGDRYWVFVNRANHRIERWEYVLENQKPPPGKATWEGWEQHGGLWFPTAHRIESGNVFTRDIETVSEFRPTEFIAP